MDFLARFFTHPVFAPPHFLVIYTEFKKHRAHIKKKSDQVMRLRKKLRKDSRPSTVVDPSVQRLVDQCMKDLNTQFRQLEDKEKRCVRMIKNTYRRRKRQ